MATATLPTRESVQELFEGLFGEDVLVRENSEAVDSKAKIVTATYVDDNEKPARAITCDLAFANGAGAALTMIAVGVVQDAIKDGEVPPSILSNLQEVFNICVNVFSECSDTHLVLGVVTTPDVETSIDTTNHITFDVELPRYGKGKISLISLD